MPLPKRISPIVIAIILSIILIVWMLSGNQQSSQTSAPAPQQLPEDTLSHVETRWSTAQAHQPQLVAQGQLLPWRQVSIKARQQGTVEKILHYQGEFVSTGDKLLQLSDEGRNQQLQQAIATLKLRKSELESARLLGKSKFLSETELLRLESEWRQAEAELKTAELAVSYLQPQAPFNGVIDRRLIEIGDFLQVGTEMMQLVDIGQLKVTAQIPQQQISRVKPEQKVKLQLLDGRQLQGEVSFVSYAADTSTRSFYIEVTAQNPQQWRIAGASATLHIQLDPVMAHRLSPALLSLNKAGKLGISLVNTDNLVEFHAVEILSADNEGAWLTGLPERAKVITLGAGFVSQGQQVTPKEVTP